MRFVFGSLAGLTIIGVALLGTRAVSAASVGPCGAPVGGSARVVVVVDNGVGAVSTECIVVPRGTTGSQVLRQRAAQLGTAVPGHAGSGLLCTIDSYPSSGCAETASGSYWANFSAQGTNWNYSSYNPFIRRVCDGDVEGWRYVVRGTGAAGDSTPRVLPDSLRPIDARGCNDTSTPAPSSGQSGTAGDLSSAGNTVDGRSNDPVSQSGAAGAAGSVDGQPGATDAGSGDGASPMTSSSGNDAEPNSVGQDSEGAARKLPSSESASTSWIGLVAALALIGALGTAALLRSRRAQ